MLERLKNIKEKYDFLSKELIKEETIKDIEKLKKLSKEQSALKEAVELYEAYKKVLKEIEKTKSMDDEPEFIQMIEEELKKLEKEKEKLEEKIEIVLLPVDENDKKNVVMEIRGAAGGDEANIFAGDLARMYSKFSERKKWNFEVINSVEGTSGGFSQIEIIIKGENVFSKLKYESGAHRVQRVPNTETQGRVHTSTATVLVMPEAEDIDIEIKDTDLKIDVYRSGGAGGQSVNTTDSAVRITHQPTGIVVTCQNERSQLKNKEQALKILKTRIYDYQVQKEEAALMSERKNKIGSGDRSEKVRTYNYPQNRVTDHRIGYTSMNLDKIMEGHIEDLIESLVIEDQKRKLESESK